MRISSLRMPGGPALAIIVYTALPATYDAGGADPQVLEPAARWTLALAAWMAWWWLTEAVPVAVTALLPVALFPLLGVAPLKTLSSAYAHPLIFLFFGGFLISIAIEKWRLHEWIAGCVIGFAAGNERRLVAGFMAVAAFASMWLSNTATAIMMLPIALSLIHAHDSVATAGERGNFARCVLLGVAYAASIGGTATLIGSPPNLFVASFVQEQLGVTLDFRLWMAAALPVTLCLLPLTWFALTRVIAPVSGHNTGLTAVPGGTVRWHALAPAAKRVAVVFVLTVAGWLARPWLQGLAIADIRPLATLSDTAIALLGGMSLFAISAGNERVLEWRDVEKLPFGTLILFGGGLALAASLRASGADQFIGAQLAGLGGVPPWLLLTIVVTAVVLLTELTSNTAATTTLAPILAAAAVTLGLDAVSVVVVTALAASCAFMMPVATPPNAIVFASGRVTIMQMATAGLVVNVLAIVVITLLASTWIPHLVKTAGGTW